MNGPLTGLERFLERVAERPLARVLPVAAPPEEIVRRLERAAADAARARGGDGSAPASWEVRVPAGAAIARSPEAAGAALAEELRRRGNRRGIRFAALPEVLVTADPALPRSGLRIRALPGPPAAGDAVPSPVHPGEAADGTHPVADAPTPWAAPAFPATAVDREASAAAADRHASRAAGGAILTVRVPGLPVGRIAVGAGALRIGRGRTCEVRLPDAAVSRIHGRIAWQQGVLVYTDLGSRNGSLLNGRPVAAAALGAGDRLLLGGSVIDVDPAAPT